MSENGMEEVHRKLDALLVDTALNTQRTEQIESQIVELKDQHKTFNEKLDSLSSFQTFVKGAWAAVGLAGGWIVSHLPWNWNVHS